MFAETAGSTLRSRPCQTASHERGVPDFRSGIGVDSQCDTDMLIPNHRKCAIVETGRNAENLSAFGTWSLGYQNHLRMQTLVCPS